MQIVQSTIRCKECKIKSNAVKVLAADELQILEANCVEGSLKKGESIFHEGMPPSHIVYLRSGFCKIHMKGSGNYIFFISWREYLKSASLNRLILSEK